jgi:hypothetical protein
MQGELTDSRVQGILGGVNTALQGQDRTAGRQAAEGV